MISFIPRVGKVQTGQSSGGFTAIIPIYNVRVNGHPVHQEGMLSNNLRQYVATNSKFDS